MGRKWGAIEISEAQMRTKLTDLPNIGKAMATDLMSIGIGSPDDFKGRDALQIFNDLKGVMGRRHDPCVYYTLLSVKHFTETGESLPWWKFTARGKADLTLESRRKS
jgi:DNA transformation protein